MQIYQNNQAKLDPILKEVKKHLDVVNERFSAFMPKSKAAAPAAETAAKKEE